MKGFESPEMSSYVISDVEADYAVFIIDHKSDKTKESIEKIKKNNYYCLCAVSQEPDTRCMCKEFRERASEGPCGCGVYEKRLRTETQKQKFLTTDPKINKAMENYMIKSSRKGVANGEG